MWLGEETTGNATSQGCATSSSDVSVCGLLVVLLGLVEGPGVPPPPQAGHTHEHHDERDQDDDGDDVADDVAAGTLGVVVQLGALDAAVSRAVVVRATQVLVADSLLAVQVASAALASVAVVDHALLAIRENQARPRALPLRALLRRCRVLGGGWGARDAASPRSVVGGATHVWRASHLRALHLAHGTVAALAVVRGPGCPISIDLPISPAGWRSPQGGGGCGADGAAVVLEEQGLQAGKGRAGLAEAALLARATQAAQAGLGTPRLPVLVATRTWQLV